MIQMNHILVLSQADFLEREVRAVLAGDAHKRRSGWRWALLGR